MVGATVQASFRIRSARLGAHRSFRLLGKFSDCLPRLLRRCPVVANCMLHHLSVVAASTSPTEGIVAGMAASIHAVVYAGRLCDLMGWLARLTWSDTKLRISLNSNSSRGIIKDITRYGPLEGFGMVQNTSTGCGNNLPNL